MERGAERCCASQRPTLCERLLSKVSNRQPPMIGETIDLCSGGKTRASRAFELSINVPRPFTTSQLRTYFFQIDSLARSQAPPAFDRA